MRKIAVIVAEMEQVSGIPSSQWNENVVQFGELSRELTPEQKKRLDELTEELSDARE